MNSFKIIETSHNTLDAFWGPVFYIILVLTGQVAPLDILIIYALETVIIGLFHFIKIVASGAAQSSIGKGLFFGGFFLVHYMIFCFGQMYLFYMILGLNPLDGSNGVITNTLRIIATPEVRNSLIVMMIIIGYRTWNNFFRQGKHRTIEIGSYFFQPYGRIILQQFVALLPFFVFDLMDQKIFAAILLIALRAIVDFVLFQIQNNQFAAVRTISEFSKKDNISKSEIKESIDFIYSVNGTSKQEKHEK